jgi:broad specificity phosphatase PhoE
MIYFVRHGESEANVAGVFAGQKDDSPLTTKGRRDARSVANEINEQNIQFDEIVSSPLKRASQTAKIIANSINFPTKNIKYTPGISEYDMGILTGTPLHEISSQELVTAQDAEDPTLFQKRVMSVVKQYSNNDTTVLFVSHAGVGRIIEATRQNIAPSEFYSIKPYPNGHLQRLS